MNYTSLFTRFTSYFSHFWLLTSQVLNNWTKNRGSPGEPLVKKCEAPRAISDLGGASGASGASYFLSLLRG